MDENENNVVKLWKDSGLLDGLEIFELEIVVASLLEETAQLALKCIEENTWNHSLTDIIFPVVKRVAVEVYRKNEKMAELLKAEFFVEELLVAYPILVEKFPDIFYNMLHGFDAEEEVISMASEIILEKFFSIHSNSDNKNIK